jgi:hypothetical protein
VQTYATDTAFRAVLRDPSDSNLNQVSWLARPTVRDAIRNLRNTIVMQLDTHNAALRGDLAAIEEARRALQAASLSPGPAGGSLLLSTASTGHGLPPEVRRETPGRGQPSVC